MWKTICINVYLFAGIYDKEETLKCVRKRTYCECY